MIILYLLHPRHCQVNCSQLPQYRFSHFPLKFQLLLRILNKVFNHHLHHHQQLFQLQHLQIKSNVNQDLYTMEKGTALKCHLQLKLFLYQIKMPHQAKRSSILFKEKLIILQLQLNRLPHQLSLNNKDNQNQFLLKWLNQKIQSE